MIFGKKAENKELEKFALMLCDGIVSLFETRGEIKFSQKPVIEKTQIIEYEGRMRIDGMEKFNNEPTYISTVNYYASPKDMEKHNTLGVVVIYVQEEFLAKMMQLLKYPKVDDENDDELRDSAGTLGNLIAGNFKSSISAAGYIELEMSHFTHYRNSSFVGVAFCDSEYNKYTLSFDIKDQKRLVVEVSMGVVPKA